MSTKLSEPAPPTNSSTPTPPSIKSLPAPPTKISSPPRPRNVIAIVELPFDTKVSLAAEPTKTSKPLTARTAEEVDCKALSADTEIIFPKFKSTIEPCNPANDRVSVPAPPAKAPLPCPSTTTVSSPAPASRLWERTTRWSSPPVTTPRFTSKSTKRE